MDTPEVERELEELENRIERLRALYEQYFMGIEKMEPQIPRKDVDRRIWILRREQIRNTGLRFKFQMLIQRYNTFQQYWARVAREIENGTYRRDVMRAALRVGEKEALTVLGKKRAQQFKTLLDNQRALRDGARRSVEEITAEDPPVAAEAAPPSEWGDITEVMDAHEVDDDAPTPPPAPAQRATGARVDGAATPPEPPATPAPAPSVARAVGLRW
ncbi:MAG TPA: hypothetical protein VHB21_25150, partial [Minicystis sp.]|nr:hypothetical protein [Minicystis sp.]